MEAGYLTRRTRGIADAYALTDAGENALEEHYEWLSARVDGGRERDLKD